MRPAILAACCLLAGLAAGACSTHAPPVTDEPSASHGAAGGESGVANDDGSARPERMLRFVLRLSVDGLEVVSLIAADNTVNRRDPHRGSTAFWRSFDAGGSLLEERGFRLEAELRSEVPGPDGTIEGARVPLDEPVFDVAVPLRPGIKTIRFFRAAPGAGRDRAEVLGELEVPADMVR
ncbi:MAG TPA: hypothetical protein VM285_08840 [Polyangia bacterium]|nr:hypothetical protein [Polyangia bacterium]